MGNIPVPLSHEQETHIIRWNNTYDGLLLGGLDADRKAGFSGVRAIQKEGAEALVI